MRKYELLLFRARNALRAVTEEKLRLSTLSDVHGNTEIVVNLTGADYALQHFHENPLCLNTSQISIWPVIMIVMNCLTGLFLNKAVTITVNITD